MKKVLSVLFVFVMISAVFGVTASAKSTAIRNINDSMVFARESDPFDIRRATLYNNGRKCGNVYVIGITGTNPTFDRQVLNNIYSCVLSGIGMNSPLLKEVIKAANEKIPAGADVIIIGHSLGGMIGQQFAGNREMKEKYNILNIVGMGSPYISQIGMEGELHRMADSGDVIPYLSLAFAGNFFGGNFTYENGGFFGNPDGAHNVSYKEAEVWQKYDCLGIENGGNVLYLW
ncbi:MAG: hypothetical protein K6F64_01640 [Clostridia bacterium]|nr:hypothetical protein [Clostridia bacterium]